MELIDLKRDPCSVSKHFCKECSEVGCRPKDYDFGVSWRARMLEKSKRKELGKCIFDRRNDDVVLRNSCMSWRLLSIYRRDLGVARSQNNVDDVFDLVRDGC